MTDLLPTVISAEQLAGLHGEDLRLIHVAEGPAFQQAHLPGALLVEPRELVDGRPPAPGRLPSLERLRALLAALAHGSDVHYVIYDDEGGGWAGRFAWTLDVVGHRRWSYLDGGLPAWHAAGLPLAQGAAEPVTPTTVAPAIDTAPVAELDDVAAAIGDPEQIIWDVRSPEEYRGERSGARRAGHVPTAINLDWMRLKDPARDLKLVENLAELLADHGIDAGKRVITHCQTHHRSGLSYLVGRALGFRDIRAYHGSWAEWGNRDDTPVVTGAEPGTLEQAQRGGGG